jgi:hypothetical protein
MTNLINTAYALIESGDAQSKAHGQGMLEVIQSLPTCLNWSADDFKGDEETMDAFFRYHNDTIIEFINSLK